MRKFRRVRRVAACCSRKKALDIRNPDIQKEAKEGGSNRIIGRYGTKIWDDEGAACVIKNLSAVTEQDAEVISAICTPEGQKMIMMLDCRTRISDVNGYDEKTEWGRSSFGRTVLQEYGIFRKRYAVFLLF